MNININRTVIFMVMVVIALFTPVVEGVITVLGFVLGAVFTVLGAINGLGLLAVLLFGAWAVYNRGSLAEWFSADEDKEEEDYDWLR